MRRLRTAIVVTTAAALLGTAGTMLAYAGGWTVPDGKAEFTVRVAKMPRGVTPSAAKQDKTAVVSWSAQEIAPNVRMDHYLVTAHSVSEPPLPDVTKTVAASGATTESVTFTATQVAGGRWQWTIVPRFKSWTGAESGKSQRLTLPALTKAEAAVEAAKEAVAATDAAVDVAVAPAPPAAPASSGPAAAPTDPPTTGSKPPAESKLPAESAPPAKSTPSTESKPSPTTEPKDPPAAQPPAPEATSSTAEPAGQPAAMGSAETNLPG